MTSSLDMGYTPQELLELERQKRLGQPLLDAPLAQMQQAVGPVTTPEAELAAMESLRQSADASGEVVNPGLTPEFRQNASDIWQAGASQPNVQFGGMSFNDVTDKANAVAEGVIDAPFQLASWDKNKTARGVMENAARVGSQAVGFEQPTEDMLARVSGGMPRAVADVGLMSLGGAGLPLALADTASAAYAPNHDPIAAIVAPAVLAAGGAVIPAVGRLAGGATARALQPTFQDLVAAPAAQYGRMAQQMIKPSLGQTAAIGASRLAGEAAAGTAVNEAGRMTEETLHGDTPKLPDVNSLAENALQTLMFAPLDASMAKFHPDPAHRAQMQSMQAGAVRSQEAARTIEKADFVRKFTRDDDALRGTRIANSHKAIFEAMKTGQDTTGMMEELKSHYQEADAVRQPTAKQAGDVLMAIGDEANTKGLNELDIASIVNGVTGRFDEATKLDPESKSPLSVSGAAVSSMVEKGVLPKITDEWVKTNFKDAYDQALGDDRVARANLVNRITAHYEGLLPEAVSAYRNMPRETGVSRKELNAGQEAEKDVAYMQALGQLMPHMQGKKAPDGSALDEAFLNRDIEHSTATQGSQLQSESAAWGKYDSWKDAVIHLSQTYDPVTRTGEFLPSRRMADGEMITGKPVQMSLESLVEKAEGKKYKVEVPAKRKIDRPGQSSALNDALELAHERFGAEKPDTDLENLEDPIAFKEERSKLVKEDEELVVPSDEEGGKAVVEPGTEESKVGQFEENAASKPEFYDIGLHLMNKVEKADPLELWNKYGGQEVFGRGALSPGKATLFKDAILAKLESDMDDTGTLTAAQKRFYEGWRKSADAKEGGAAALPATWKEQRAQFRHAMRLYWPRAGMQFDDFFLKMLDDKPEYQAMLKGTKRGPQGAFPGKYPVVDNGIPSSNPEPLVPLTNFGERFTSLTGQTTVPQDVLRTFYGRGKKLGMSDIDAQEFALTAHSMQKALDENTRFGKIHAPDATLQGGNWSPERPMDPGTVGINFDRINENTLGGVQRAVRSLQVLAHELAHNYTGNPDPRLNSAYKQQRVDAHAKLKAMFEDLGPQAADDMLNNVLHEVFIPPQYRNTGKSNLTYPGAKFGDEAVSRLMEMTMLGAFTRYSLEQPRSTYQNFDLPFQWLPEEVQAFSRLAFRDLSNYSGGIQDYYANLRRNVGSWTDAGRDAAKSASYFPAMMKASEDFLMGTGAKAPLYEAQGKRMLAAMQAAGSVNWADPTITYTTTDLDHSEIQRIARDNKISMSVSKDEDPHGFEEAQKLLFPEGKEPDLRLAHEKRLGSTVPPWSRWMGQFYQAMRRYEKVGITDIAPAVTRLVDQLEPSYWRLSQQLHAPFTMVDDKGMIKYDPNHPVQLLLRNKHPQAKRGLQAMENLRSWMQENQTGLKDEKAQEVITREIGKLDPVAQQGVLEGLNSLVTGYQKAAEMRYSAELEGVGSQVAKFFMLKDKEMTYDTAFSSAQAAVSSGVDLARAAKNANDVKEAAQAYQQKNAQNPQLMADPQFQKLQQAAASALQNLNSSKQAYAEATQGLSPEQAAVMQNYVVGPTGVAEGLMKMADMFNSRRDWFMSEARPGQYLIFGKTPDGKDYASSKRDQGQAKGHVKKLSQEGYTDLDIVDRDHQDVNRIFDSPDAVINSFLKLEKSSWQNFLSNMRGKLDESDMAQLEADGYEPGLASQKFVENKGLDRYMQQRKLQAGRDELDSFEVFNDYTRRLVGTVARKGTRQQMDLILRDPRVKGQGEFQNTVREAMTALMQPVGDKFMTARAAITAMFLGLPNVVSPLIESTQSMTTVFPELIREGGSYVGAVKNFSNAPVHMFKYGDATSLENRRLIQSAMNKETLAPSQMTKEESLAYYYKKSKDEGRFSHGVVQQNMLARDAELLDQWGFGMGLGGSSAKTKKELAGDVLYWASQKAMLPYSAASSMNNKVAFMAGLEMLYDKGLRGRELYETAHVFKNRATFGGGKPNEVGYVAKVSNPNTRSWFSLVNTLQRYGFGSTTQIKDLAADMIGTTKLAPAERIAATKAVTHALVAQTVLAGAMGLPGAAIAAAVIQKTTDWDMKQALRSLWYRLSKGLGADDPLAVGIANVAQNGVGGQFTGMDLSSRFALNSFMGFDSYEGFNTNNLLGPSASIVERMIQAGKYVEKGNMVKAASNALPPSMSPLIDIASQTKEFGNVGMRTADGKLIRQLTPGETIRYAAGVRPYWYRQYRDLQAYKTSSETAFGDVRDQKVDAAASALRGGNNQPTFDWVNDYLKQSPGGDPKEAVQSVINRALVQTNGQDLLSSSVRGNQANLTSAAKTFGEVTPRQSEVDLLVQREKLNAQTGYAGGKPVDSKQITHAALVDALIQAHGMDRTSAENTVTQMGY